MKCSILLPVFVRLQPGKEETFSPRYGHIFFVFPRGRRRSVVKTMNGLGGKGHGKPGTGKGKGKDKGKRKGST